MSARDVCRHYRPPRLAGPGAGSTTCDAGVTYLDLLPTPEAQGSGWVRRLPCVGDGLSTSLPRLPGGCECPLRVVKLPAEEYADYAPVRRVARAVEHMTGDEARALNRDKPRLAAFMAEHTKPVPGDVTLERTPVYVALICACGARTEIEHAAPLTCTCGRTYAMQYVHAHGDHALVETTSGV